MKIVLIRSDKRKGSMTRYCTDLVLKGLMAGGAEVLDVDLHQQKITPCDGCFNCWALTPGRCKFSDDMGPLLEQIQQADILFLTTPLHHYGMSAALAEFIERTFPLTKMGFIPTELGLFRNEVAWDAPGKKQMKLAYLSVCGFNHIQNFSALKEHFKMIAQGVHFDLCGQLLRPEGFLLPFHQAHPRTIKAIETALEKAGYELATVGRVSDATMQEVSQPIAANEENYVQHSTIFWEYVYKNAPEDRGLNQRRASDFVVRDVRVLMSEIVTYVDPEATKRLRIDFQFHFTDVDRHYHIVIDHGTAKLIEESVMGATLTITTTQQDWAAMFLREISPMEALSQKRIILEGDKSLFTRFERLFPPPRD